MVRRKTFKLRGLFIAIAVICAILAGAAQAGAAGFALMCIASGAVVGVRGALANGQVTPCGQRLARDVGVYTVANIATVVAAAHGVFGGESLMMPAAFGSILPLLAVCFLASERKRYFACENSSLLAIGALIYLLGLAVLNLAVYGSAQGAV